MPDNSVTVIGNLTQDPELRFTPSGVAMARINVAVNRRWRNRTTNEWEEEASFFNGTCWQELAENVSESLQKGSRVIINGRLQQRSWETQEGERRSVVEIRIDEIGPSLRWATASVTRTPRRGGDDWGGSSQPAAQSPGPVARDTYGPEGGPLLEGV